MEVKEFIAECERMCNYYGGRGYCKRVIRETTELCPLSDLITCTYLPDLSAKAIDDVEKWSKENPKKTRQSEFLKQFTKANVDENGVIRICPNYIDSTVECHAEVDCGVCREKYWNEVVE